MSQDFIQELQQSITQEKMQRYSKLILMSLAIATVILIVGMVLFSWYRTRAESKIYREGLQLISLAQTINRPAHPSEDIKQPLQKLEQLAAEGTTSYSALANFYLASLELTKGHDDKAIYYYTQVADNSAHPSGLRDIALMSTLLTKLQSDKVKLSPKEGELLQYLNTLESSSSPVNYGAKVLHASILYSLKDYPGALAIITDISQNEQADDVTKGISRYLTTLTHSPTSTSSINQKATAKGK